MSIAAVKIKFMPVSPESDLEKIEKEAGTIIEAEGGKGSKFEKKPIAFGLNALEVLFAWPEEKELEELEEKLKKIENINSVQVVDIRRAIG
jgi:translation elongation factor aEF-1 beta